MFDYHTTANGKQMLICEMTNLHLYRTIKGLCQKIKICTFVIEAKPITNNTIVKVMCPERNPELQKQKAEKVLKQLHAKLAPYICEAALRGMVGLPALLQDAYNRTVAIEVFDFEQEMAKSISGSSNNISANVDYNDNYFDDDSFDDASASQRYEHHRKLKKFHAVEL